MTTLPECLTRKATEGIIDRDTANRLRREYRQAMRRARDATEAGNLILAKEQRRLAARKKSKAATLSRVENIRQVHLEADRRSDGTEKGRAKWAKVAARSLFGFDKGGRFTGPSIETEKAMLRRRAHRRLSDFLPEVQPNAVGQVRNKTLMDNVLREKLGQDTGDKTAKQYAEGLKEAFEYLRREGNRAGMSIPFMENYFPQKWSPEKLDRAVQRKGREKAKQDWIEDIEPRLDRDQMLDAETGLPMDDDRLREVLDNVFETIRTRGFNKWDKDKGHFAAKDLAANRANERFLIFRSPEDWLEAQQRYGQADEPNGIYDTMMGHLDDMSNDAAIARILGPQPDASVRQIKNELKARNAQPFWADVDALYNVVSRRANIAENEKAAQWGHALRNLVNAGAMGGAFISALTDTAFSTVSQAFVTGNRVGAPVRTMSTLARNFFNPSNPPDQRAALRTIGVADQMLNRTQELNRLMIDELGPMGSVPRAAQWLNQQVMRLSLLNRWTAMGRQVFELETLNEVTRQSRRQWSELTDALRASFQRVGIDEGDWDAIRAEENRFEARPGMTVLHPESIAKSAPEAAEKLDRMLFQESRFAVPQTGVVERAGIIGNTRPGTFWGETTRTVGMLKSFPLTQLVNQHARIFNQINTAKGKLAYTAALTSVSAATGAFALQLDTVVGGKDPRPVNTAFLQDALIRAGTFGMFGDLAFGGVSKYGLLDTLVGPMGSAAQAGLTAAGASITLASRLAQGDDLEEATRESDAGRELLDFVDEVNPLGSLWFTQLAFERAIHDQIKRMVDPEAENSFRTYEEFIEDKTDTQFFWAPGDFVPERGPEVSGG